MPSMRTILIASAGVGLLLAAAPSASAYAQDSSAYAGQSTYTVSQQTVKLSPITVQGHPLILPLFLQIVKTALHRPVSFKWKDRNTLICRFRDMMGSHIQTLFCETNGQYYNLAEKTQLAINNASAEHGGSPDSAFYEALMSGQIPVTIGNYTSQHPVSRGQMMTLLKKLPPAGSSYTLKVMDHGKPAVDYVIKDGELEKVRHYIYKDDKKESKKD